MDRREQQPHKSQRSRNSSLIPDSIFHYYRKLIALRKELDVIAYGGIDSSCGESIPVSSPMKETYDGHKLIVACNFYGKDYEWKGAPDVSGYKRVIGNYSAETTPENGVWKMRPYEAAVWYR